MQLFITAIFGLVLFVGVAASCPDVCSCYTNPKGVNVICMSKGLDTMPSDLPNNTYELHFNRNKITSIDPTTFQNMNALSYIHLENNQITAILSETFKDLPNLVSLHLYNNKISVIEDNAFNNLTSLSNLELQYNEISVIEDNAFNNLPSLSGLHLYNNRISVIKDNTFNNLPSLQYIIMRNNNISFVNNKTFENLPQLTSLYLDNNKISVIEDNAFNNLPRLFRLYLHNNKISVIKDNTFNNLPSLYNLSMQNNNISFVSNKAFENLPQLTALYFDMYCGGCDNIPFWRWLKVNQKFSTSVRCNDYSGTYLANLQPSSFSHCIITSSLCGVTICRRQQRDSSFIKCDTGRILIENVTGIDRTFSSLRRICTGKKSCDIYRICQDPRNQNIRVSYTCNILPPTEPLKTCTSDIMVLNQEHGVILSPRYPDIVIVSCSWRIAVPRDHFAVITVHDLERQVDNCNGGLQIRARQNCPNNTIPAGLICKLKKHSIVYRACGDVDVDLVTNMISGLRFWISYQVFPMFKTPMEYRAHYSCPEGTETKQEVKREPVMPLGVETEQRVKAIQVIPPITITRTISMLNTTIHFDNETANDKIETKQTTGINSAERMIFYVAIAVAFLSLNGLIVVTVICIRRQRRLKANGPIIDHSAIPSTYHASFNCNRPLPPVANQHSQLTNSPSLMDGYGVVADDIPQGCNDQISESSAYAEVDDTLPYRAQPYRYSLEKPKTHESIENVYSELTDNEKGGYWEIADTVWHNTPYSQTDNDKLIKREKWRKSHCSNNSTKSRPSSFEGPFSHFNGKRKSELSENTDSDDSLFGNDQYDYIQSVHV